MVVTQVFDWTRQTFFGFPLVTNRVAVGIHTFRFAIPKAILFLEELPHETHDELINRKPRGRYEVETTSRQLRVARKRVKHKANSPQKLCSMNTDSVTLFIQTDHTQICLLKSFDKIECLRFNLNSERLSKVSQISLAVLNYA